MAKTALTLRIATEDHNALKNLSKIEGRPVNQLMVEALKSYLGQQGQKERSLEASLASLQAYRKKDPGLKRVIDALVEGEATNKDPLEGEIYEETSAANPLKPAEPVQNKVQEILGARLG